MVGPGGARTSQGEARRGQEEPGRRLGRAREEPLRNKLAFWHFWFKFPWELKPESFFGLSSLVNLNQKKSWFKFPWELKPETFLGLSSLGNLNQIWEIFAMVPPLLFLAPSLALKGP